MAVVDFSNARIEPANLAGRFYQNPTMNSYVTLYSGVTNFFDASGNIISSLTIRQLTNEQKHFVNQYQGTFSASGTEFYIQYQYNAGWKVSNIAFNSGDTFDFTIRADLICQ